MTTENLIKRITRWLDGDVSDTSGGLLREALAALATSQQEPVWFAVLFRRAPVLDKTFRREDVANEYADKHRADWPDIEVVPLYRAALAAPQPAEPVAWCQLNNNKQVAYFDGKPMIMTGPVGNECHPHPLYTAPQPADAKEGE